MANMLLYINDKYVVHLPCTSLLSWSHQTQGINVNKILLLGLGKVGTLAGILLKKAGFSVTGIDSTIRQGLPFPTVHDQLSTPNHLLSLLQQHDAIVSCLPFHLNSKIAPLAHKANRHYFDLTEDIHTTKTIRTLARTSAGLMAPQCGLAPGFIGIIGASLAKNFERLRSIELRVGALPQNPKGAIGYAFNWSPEGVVNEYLNDCSVIRGGKKQLVPAMQELETIIIKGRRLEAFTTSGGLGTLCETFLGKVEELNYKTMRYPGHMNIMRVYFHELLMRSNRKLAGEILVNAKPPVNDDVVYIHAAAEGWRTISGTRQLYRDEYVESYYPKTIDNIPWRAISWTTACSLVAVIELVAKGKLPQKGFLKQEDIPLDDFFNTYGGSYYQT